MFFNSKIFRAVCIACLVLSLTVLAFADTIRLKDGSIIKGKIVSFTGGKFTIIIDNGSRQRELSFRADEVESIVFESGNLPVADVTNPARSSDDSMIIPAGQTSRTNNPQTTSPKVSNPGTNTQTTSSTNSTSKPNPIQINVKVLADNTANGWTNSGWVVRKGQKIRISSSGRVSLGSGRFTTPAGISSLPDNDKLVKNGATGALIAVIGDDNNDFILVGEQREFIAERDGALFLGVNEGNLNDNSGAFSVTIEIDPTM